MRIPTRTRGRCSSNRRMGSIMLSARMSVLGTLVLVSSSSGMQVTAGMSTIIDTVDMDIISMRRRLWVRRARRTRAIPARGVQARAL